jgi:hypothetical protein
MCEIRLFHAFGIIALLLGLPPILHPELPELTDLSRFAPRTSLAWPSSRIEILDQSGDVQGAK